MKTLLVYYSYSGTTKQIAQEIAQRENTALCEAKEVKRLPGIGSFFVGCPQAIRHKARAIQPLEKNMADYEKIIIMGPIWAGRPAPAVNAIIDALPQGKTVEFRMTSGSGTSKDHEKTTERAVARGCTAEGYLDIKSS
ncbi:hypothetical protein LJC56_03495 [Christensenellaceae bacterium OttesenSCG-928-K19]|nr:hypothetical protein [Christensenellaceae bacterium OttesenSCG-928-K19]